MSSINEEEIFRKGSTTYYFSSKFFDKKIRNDVFKLYSFVRVVDDYVDQPKPDVKNFNEIQKTWNAYKESSIAPARNTLNDAVSRNIIEIVEKYSCEISWVDAFMASMQMDIDRRVYSNIDETLEYIYGSAEIIGLFMAKILDLPKEAVRSACMQGRAMQYINFIRDINEDISLGRAYFPTSEVHRFGLNTLSRQEALANPDAFSKFISFQLQRYSKWQAEADKGLHFIPKRQRIAVKTAVDMYNWTAKNIEKNPLIIFETKVKPRKRRILLKGISNSVHP